MNLTRLIKDGHKYMKIFPQDARFKQLFPEAKIIDLIRLSSRFMPPIIVAVFVWQYYLNTNIILSIITAFFALSLPIQGIFWLGKRAQTTLPLNLLGWFNQLRQELIEHDIIGKKPIPPTFMALIKLLNLTKENLGDYFANDDEQQ